MMHRYVPGHICRRLFFQCFARLVTLYKRTLQTEPQQCNFHSQVQCHSISVMMVTSLLSGTILNPVHSETAGSYILCNFHLGLHWIFLHCLHPILFDQNIIWCSSSICWIDFVKSIIRACQSYCHSLPQRKNLQLKRRSIKYLIILKLMRSCQLLKIVKGEKHTFWRTTETRNILLETV